MQNKSQKPAVMPYLALYNLCVAPLSKIGQNNLHVSWLMAIAFKETMGNAFFSPFDLTYQANLKAMPLQSELERNQWTAFIKVTEGPFKGQIPKFRYERSFDATFQQKWKDHQYDSFVRWVNACSWGIGQKAGVYMFDKIPLEQQLPIWRQFCSDPDLQVRTMAIQLRRLIQLAGGDLMLAFSKYNQGDMCKVITDYGKEVYAFAVGFDEKISEFNLPNIYRSY